MEDIVQDDEGGAAVPAEVTEVTPELEEAFEKFRACAVDVLNVAAEQVTLDATFESLEADSLDLVELVMALEEAFEITVEEKELEGVTSIGKAFSLVTAKI